jgi:hypothetical protein
MFAAVHGGALISRNLLLFVHSMKRRSLTALHPELKRRHFMGRELKRSLHRRLLGLPEV